VATLAGFGAVALALGLSVVAFLGLLKDCESGMLPFRNVMSYEMRSLRPFGTGVTMTSTCSVVSGATVGDHEGPKYLHSAAVDLGTVQVLCSLACACGFAEGDGGHTTAASCWSIGEHRLLDGPYCCAEVFLKDGVSVHFCDYNISRS
jgi:hypothetical protein